MKKIVKRMFLVLLLTGGICGIFTQVTEAKEIKLSTPEITLSNVKSSGKIQIKWKPVENAVSYQVYRSKDGNKWGRIITTKKTSVVNANAVAGKKYYYKVKAIASDKNLNSAFSKAKYRTCDLERPSVSFSSNKNTGKTIITWGKIEEAVSYKVYSSKDKKKWTLLKTTKNKTVTHTNAVGGVKYYYKVRAIASNTAANSAYSEIKSKKCIVSVTSNYQKAVVNLAKEIATEWKTVYVQGETGKKNSSGAHQFDCSGFATYVINTVMVKEIPTFRLTSSIKKLYAMEAVYNEGYPGEFNAKTIKLQNIQPGDIIFFSHHSANDHCGIYIGNNKFAHCTKSKGGTVIDSLSGIYERDFSEVRRYIPAEVTAANTKKTISKACSLYAVRSDDGSKIRTLNSGEKVTVVFTGNNPESYNQAYVKTNDGKKGFIYTKNIK